MFEPLREAAGAVPVRWLDRGFKGLVFVVTGQQISVAAGRAIYGRLEAALGDITAETVAAANDDVLRAAGFSAPKIRTLRALRDAAMGGALDLDALEEQSAEEAILSLCTHQGDRPLDLQKVYLLFAAGHPDIFPAADVALQESRGSPLRSMRDRRRAISARCPMPGRPGAAPRRVSFGPTTA